jgi:PadR family transcriptional regulator
VFTFRLTGLIAGLEQPSSPLAGVTGWGYDVLGNRVYRMSKPNDLVQGTLDLLILKILAIEPRHGLAIANRLRQVSGDVLQVSDGSLYPALHKLEHDGWIKAEWKTSELGRRAKYYSVTRSGHRRLNEETANWKRLSVAINQVVDFQEA